MECLKCLKNINWVKYIPRLTASRQSLLVVLLLPKNSPMGWLSYRGIACQSSGDRKKKGSIVKHHKSWENMNAKGWNTDLLRTYPFNHDIFYNRDSWFIADFVKIPWSAREKTIISNNNLQHTLWIHIFFTLHVQWPLTSQTVTPGPCWQRPRLPCGPAKLPG